MLARAARSAGAIAIAPAVARLAGGCEASGSVGTAHADEPAATATPGAAAAAPAPSATEAPQAAGSAAAAVSPEIEHLLATSEFVYISSTRKDGTLSRKAEIWFTWHDGSVWVGTRPDSWRAKRILERAGEGTRLGSPLDEALAALAARRPRYFPGVETPRAAWGTVAAAAHEPREFHSPEDLARTEDALLAAEAKVAARGP